MAEENQPQKPTPKRGEHEDDPKFKSEDEMSEGKDYPIKRDPPHFKFDPKAPTPQEGQGQGGYG
jgi:hypothetical protein